MGGCPPAVDESWDIIVDWLGRNSLREFIRPPAAEDDLRDVERVMGTALPDDLGRLVAAG
jgi:cell wall assembly regulator SMI1